jgi:hypothetical protein
MNNLFQGFLFKIIKNRIKISNVLFLKFPNYFNSNIDDSPLFLKEIYLVQPFFGFQDGQSG